MIEKFKYATPGRLGNYTDENADDESSSNAAKATGNGQAERIIALLGGRENITLVDACMTRLRVTVKDLEKVADIAAWKAEGAMGLLKKELPRVFALQEVNQSMSAEKVEKPKGYVSCSGGKFIGITSGTKGKSCIEIRKDNHAYRLSQLLRANGLEYEWTWIGAKVGYGKYDEGLALFSRTCIWETAEFCISKIKDYSNWKTRKVLGIKTGIVPAWYFSIHMGWWDDKEEPFSDQWDCFCKHLSQLGLQKNRCYIMGDFNSPSNIPREGYEYIKKFGWYDTWQLAKEKDSGITVGKVIDGWKEQREYYYQLPVYHSNMESVVFQKVHINL